MERIVFKIEHEEFGTEYELDDTNRIEGSVHRGFMHEDKFIYESKGGGSHTENKEEATCIFEFSFVWRGVWEGRIYFKEDEYFEEDLEIINEIWKRLRPQFQTIIRANYPNQKLED